MVRWVIAGLLGVLGLMMLPGCATTAPAPAVTITETVTVTATPAASGSPYESPSAAGTPAPQTGAPQTGAPQTGSGLAPTTATSDLTTMRVAELPPEAVALLPVIKAGGPFEYRQDGQTFQNREGRLPSQPMGFYREYTIETPGSSDRGARRFVVGSNGAVFYTDNHYSSFREVLS